MPDRLSADKRSRLMGRVRGKNTKPEMIVRSVVHRMGFRFRLHRKNLPGTPDIVLPKHKKIILVHGCFWHGHDCPRSKHPASHQEFWDRKLNSNIERDARNHSALEASGWSILVVWECETRKPELLLEKLRGFLCGRNPEESSERGREEAPGSS